MQKGLFILPLCFLFFAGCQTMGRTLNNEHTQTHDIEIQAIGKNKRFSKDIYVRHLFKKENVNLMLIGDVERPMGALVSLVKVKARFMDDKGQVIREEYKNAYFRNAGSHAHRKYQGSFYIEIPDNADIVKCEVEFT
jgi:hypothetical protein